MFYKVAGLVAWLVAVSASDPGYGRPLPVPQVGISKGIRSHSPEIIYLTHGIDNHNTHIGGTKHLDPNDVIASVYGPAFLRPEWIWSGQHQISHDPDHDNHHGRNRHHEPERVHGLHLLSQQQRHLQLKRLRDEEILLGIKSHREQERILELKRLQEQERLNEIRRLRDKERLIELQNHREQQQLDILQRQRNHQQWNNLENQRAQVNLLLRLGEQKHAQEIRHRIPDLELGRLRELEHQREDNRVKHLSLGPETVGNRPYPGYDYPVVIARPEVALRHNTGLRYADAGYYGRDVRPQEPHGWGKGYRPAWARLPEIAFHGRHHGLESDKHDH